MTPTEPPLETAGAGSQRGRFSTRRLGLYVLFISLSALFAASIVAYLVTRAQNSLWRQPDMPALPRGLWLSTALIFGISATLQSAIAAVRKNHLDALLRRLAAGALQIGLFLAAQSENWLTMMRGTADVAVRTLYPYTFYLLTGLHAAHVLGGLLPLGIVIHHAWRRDYSSSSHEGVTLCVQYWHYLGVVWLVLFTVLEVMT
jgi:cytochrome c oxidase subunit 3